MTRWIVLLVALAYLGSYAVYRGMNAEVWSRDGRTYVIYPADPGLLYYFWRPLAYADSAVTGIGHHIGPHIEQG